MPRKSLLLSLQLLLLFALFGHALDRQPNSDYRARREALAKRVAGGAVLLFAPIEAEGPNALYGFRQEDNFYYLTGLTEPGGAVLILPARPAADGAPASPYSEALFLPGRNASQEKWTGPKLTPESADAHQHTGFERVLPLDNLRDELVKQLPAPRVTIFTDLDATGPSARPLDWLRRANAFPNYVSFEELKPHLAALRTIKDGGEQQLIRKATDASVAAHLAVMHAMRPGVNEQEISALFQYEFLRRGCERPAYAPIVGSGFYSTVLHYSKNANVIRDGEVVVMDVAGEYSMYASDITRTLPANGSFTARQREIYNIVLGAQQAAMDSFRAGTSTRAGMKKVALDSINSHGKDAHGQPLGQYFFHGLSHFVGLNVHDPGEDVPLAPGMVFTIEPGIYMPEEKLGVRIEDIFLVGADGKLVNLSAALPRTAEAVEAAMAARPGKP